MPFFCYVQEVAYISRALATYGYFPRISHTKSDARKLPTVLASWEYSCMIPHIYVMYIGALAIAEYVKT